MAGSYVQGFPVHDYQVQGLPAQGFPVQGMYEGLHGFKEAV